MGAYCGGRSHGNPFNGLLLLIVMAAIVAVLVLAVGSVNDHALSKHGQDAVIVAECAAKGQVLTTMVNPENNHVAQVCDLPDGRLGVYITTCDLSCVTSFVKEKMKTLESVIRYLENGGYKLLR